MTITTLNQDDSIRALANYLEVRYSEAENMIDSEEYRVLTEEEAIEEATDNIEQSLWAFNYSYVIKYSEVARAIPEDTWSNMAGDLCEDFNEAVRAMLLVENNLDEFTEDAILTEGLGHFLNTYDGSHIESNDECSCNLDANYIILKLQ